MVSKMIVEMVVAKMVDLDISQNTCWYEQYSL
jgi:hypothetical protein